MASESWMDRLSEKDLEAVAEIISKRKTPVSNWSLVMGRVCTGAYRWYDEMGRSINWSLMEVLLEGVKGNPDGASTGQSLLEEADEEVNILARGGYDILTASNFQPYLCAPANQRDIPLAATIISYLRPLFDAGIGSPPEDSKYHPGYFYSMAEPNFGVGLLIRDNMPVLADQIEAEGFGPIFGSSG